MEQQWNNSLEVSRRFCKYICPILWDAGKPLAREAQLLSIRISWLIKLYAVQPLILAGNTDAAHTGSVVLHIKLKNKWQKTTNNKPFFILFGFRFNTKVNMHIVRTAFKKQMLNATSNCHSICCLNTCKCDVNLQIFRRSAQYMLCTMWLSLFAYGKSQILIKPAYTVCYVSSQCPQTGILLGSAHNQMCKYALLLTRGRALFS